jgi:hypothetical protein
MHRRRTRIRLVAVILAVVLLAGVGVAVAMNHFSSGSKSGSGQFPTTGEYAPLSVPHAKLFYAGGVVVNEPEAGAATWVSASLSRLAGKHRYQVRIDNTSNLGSINAIQWYPPQGARILRVVGSSTGHCAISGLTGFGGDQFNVLLYPNILCIRLSLRPPSCTCKGDGGSMTISFVSDSDVSLPGAVQVLSATPVFRVIPSFPSH